MITFENPAFTVQVGKFTAIVRTSYAEGTLSADYDPTAYASVQGDAGNFICTAGSVEPVYQSCAEYHEAPCKGVVVGFKVSEKFFSGEALAYGTTLAEAVSNFGLAVAAHLQ